MGDCRLGQFCMGCDQREDFCDVLRIDKGFEFDGAEVGADAKGVDIVEDISDTAAHTGREVPSGGSKDDDSSPCHVLAAVVTDPFDDSRASGVSDCESFGGATANEQFSHRRAVEADVSDDDIVLGFEACIAIRIDRDTSSGEAFPDVIVCIPFDLERHTAS